MVVIDNRYELGEIVYLVTDPEQRKRLITGIKVCVDKSILYELICGTFQSYHYEAELSTEIDFETKMKA